MTTGDVQIMSTHHYGFRKGEWAIILGIVWANNRICYKVIFSDGAVDLWPVYDPSDEYAFRRLEARKLTHS